MNQTIYQRLANDAQRHQREALAATKQLRQAEQRITQLEAEQRRVRDLAECWLPINGVENWCALKIIAALDEHDFTRNSSL
jgi:hypothetical protein